MYAKKSPNTRDLKYLLKPQGKEITDDQTFSSIMTSSGYIEWATEGNI